MTLFSNRTRKPAAILGGCRFLMTEIYAKYFFESNGFELEKTAIENAAKTRLVELCLKSIWGKLAEFNKRPKTKMIADPQELFRFLASPVSK